MKSVKISECVGVDFCWYGFLNLGGLRAVFWLFGIVLYCLQFVFVLGFCMNW